MKFHLEGITTLQADGTTLTESLDFPDLAPIISTTNGNALISRNIHYPRLAWPDGDCWGYQLDHSGVDGSADGLRNWAGTGGKYALLLFVISHMTTSTCMILAY